MVRGFLSPSFVSLTKRELELLWYFASKMDTRNMVSTSRVFVIQLLDSLGISRSRVYSLISSMVEKGALRKLSRSDYMVSPEIFFKCRASKLKQLESTFNLYVEKDIKEEESVDGFIKEINKREWGNE